MYGERKFQLELYAGVLERARNHAEKLLKDIVEEAAKDGVLHHLGSAAGLGCAGLLSIQPQCEVLWGSSLL